MLGDVLQACRTHRVLLEARFAGTVAAVAVLEGLGRSLDPELDIIKAATPVVLKASAQRASKRVLGGKAGRSGDELSERDARGDGDAAKSARAIEK